MYLIGKCQYSGLRGWNENYQQAFENFQYAHDQGVLAATESLAECYRVGRGVGVDLAKSAQLLRELLPKVDPAGKDRIRKAAAELLRCSKLNVELQYEVS